MKKAAQVPGEVTALNNASTDTPEQVARDRETALAATAMAATGGKGELAPPPPLDDGPAMRTATLGGKKMNVRLSPVRRDAHSVAYGPESKLPKGTPVNKDGSVSEGTTQPYGVIGDIQTDEGLLVNRIIPLEALDQQPEAA